ncbi:MAG TPA: PIN domain-containing protein [Lacipirellulaceae bacterium]|nr:PIN domain-containing protein [Lacipirellulaceae bacterium]HMP05955.1 PIN domain-containing protein [Lacipirellulaceae bacterium]
MTAATFIDTNILLYAASNAPEDRVKRDIARQALSRPGIGFSTQVLQEFYAAAVTKQRLKMTHEEAVAVLTSLAAFPVWPVSRELVLEAVEARQRHGVSYWDAAILVAARQLGCRSLCSEDLNHGQVYDGVQVINPFASDAPAHGA